MEHFEVINEIVKKNGYKSYLEIGVAVPERNYDLIECDFKEGCDPYYDADYDYGFGDLRERLSEFREKVTYCMTSDEMFAMMPKEKKYDVIFVDGGHSEEQSKKDIINSLKHVSENGVVIVDDALPRKEEFAREERITDEWYGCVYKSILDFGRIGGRYACIKNGGVAILPAQKMTKEQEDDFLMSSQFGWEDYADDTPSKMHMVDLDKYGAKVMIYHNCEYLTKPENRHFGKDGNLIFGGTEFWIAGIAKNLSKWGYNVSVFADVLLDKSCEGVTYSPRISSYSKDISPNVFEKFDVAIVTTDIEITSKLHCNRTILAPTCELFNSNFGDFAPADSVAILSEWQKKRFGSLYKIPNDMMFRHFLPCQYDMYDDYADIEKENAMVWSSAPIRGLRFFIERVMPKIRKAIPDFKLYICGYNEDHYEKEWAKYVKGVEPMINAGKKELSTLQKKSKIWVYPNIGRSDTSGFFMETYCITAVENALAGNAIVCFNGKDGISSTLEGYSGFLDGSIINEYDENFMLYYEDAANALAEAAIRVLTDDNLRKWLAAEAREICTKYTWEKETSIICSKF